MARNEILRQILGFDPDDPGEMGREIDPVEKLKRDGLGIDVAGGPSQMDVQLARMAQQRTQQKRQNHRSNPPQSTHWLSAVTQLGNAAADIRDERAATARLEGLADQDKARRQQLQDARSAYAKSNPALAELMSQDPSIRSAGERKLATKSKELEHQRDLQLKQADQANARAASDLKYQRSLMKSEFENQQQVQNATIAHNRKVEQSKILDAGQIQGGLKDLQTKVAPLIQLQGKIGDLDEVLAPYAKGGKYEGMPIPGIGGLQGMTGGEPKSGGGGVGSAVAGGVVGAAAAGSTTRRRIDQIDHEGNTEEVIDRRLPRGAKLGLVGAAGASALDALAGQATPGRVGAAARLKEGGDQGVFTAVQALVGQIVRTNAGLSQTQSELDTVKNSIGAGNMSPETAFLRAYPRIKAALAEDMRVARETSHPQVMQQFEHSYSVGREEGPTQSPFNRSFSDYSFPQLEAAQDKHADKQQKRIEKRDRKANRPAPGNQNPRGRGYNQQSSVRDDLMRAMRGYA